MSPAVPPPPPGPVPLDAYRDRTLSLLRRYFRMSLEVGRLPSILGREIFRSRVTSYAFAGFEDAVIFVHDVERCLERLDHRSRDLIARIALQNYSYTEVARRLRTRRHTVAQHFDLAVNRLSEIFLLSGMLQKNICQEGENAEVSLNG